MTKFVAGLEPARIPVSLGETPVIQNLGPGAIYLDLSDSVSVSTGLRLSVGQVYEWPGDINKSVYVVADAAETDVRILKVG